MSTIWQSLAWKEWNEHKWKLVSILAVICGLWVIVFLTVSRERDTCICHQFLLCRAVGLHTNGHFHWAICSGGGAFSWHAFIPSIATSAIVARRHS